jgi:hypothetical protein
MLYESFTVLDPSQTFGGITPDDGTAKGRRRSVVLRAPWQSPGTEHQWRRLAAQTPYPLRAS